VGPGRPANCGTRSCLSSARTMSAWRTSPIWSGAAARRSPRRSTVTGSGPALTDNATAVNRTLKASATELACPCSGKAIGSPIGSRTPERKISLTSRDGGILNPRPLDPQVLASSRAPQHMPRSASVQQSAEVPRSVPGCVPVAVPGCCTAPAQTRTVRPGAGSQFGRSVARSGPHQRERRSWPSAVEGRGVADRWSLSRMARLCAASFDSRLIRQ
jgi:hypothetical protein